MTIDKAKKKFSSYNIEKKIKCTGIEERGQMNFECTSTETNRDLFLRSTMGGITITCVS